MGRSNVRYRDPRALYWPRVDIRTQIRRHPLARVPEGKTVRLSWRNQLPQNYPALAGEIDWGDRNLEYHVFYVLWLNGRDLILSRSWRESAASASGIYYAHLGPGTATLASFVHACATLRNQTF
jgi:hypothetical protein